VITGKDMAAHADKLTEGTKELLKRYQTMRVDVYPTHKDAYDAAVAQFGAAEVTIKEVKIQDIVETI